MIEDHTVVEDSNVVDNDQETPPLGRILLVDDEPSVLKALTRSVSPESFEIFTASSADEALEVLGEEDIDVIVSDERMPDMSGKDFLALVAQRYPETVRLMMTGYPTQENAIHAINEGQIFRYMTKPWNDIELELALREALFHKKLLIKGRAQMIAEELE